MKSSKARVLVGVLSSPLTVGAIGSLVEEIARALGEKTPQVEYAGLIKSVSELERLEGCKAGVALVATGGTEELIIGFAEKCGFTTIFYRDGFNSLPAVLEATPVLRDRGKRVYLKRYTSPGDILSEVEKISRVYEAVGRLKSCRLGLIGGPSTWLVYSRVSGDLVKERIGSEIVLIPIEEFVREIDRAVVGEGDLEAVRGARGVEVEGGEISKALKVYKALQAISEKYNLCGLTPRCFDIIALRKTTGCLALSLLNTSLYPAACEGDVPLLISMALGEFISGKPAFMGNPVIVHGDELVLAHCTAPLISSYLLLTHFESGLGVGVSVDYPVGREATLFRIDPKLENLRVGLGVVEKWDWRRDMCRTQIKLRLKGAERIVKESIGNHYALILGDWVEELTLASQLLGLRVDRIDET
jgi:L-fucose isomerase-like protein